MPRKKLVERGNFSFLVTRSDLEAEVKLQKHSRPDWTAFAASSAGVDAPVIRHLKGYREKV